MANVDPMMKQQQDNQLGRPSSLFPTTQAGQTANDYNVSPRRASLLNQQQNETQVQSQQQQLHHQQQPPSALKTDVSREPTTKSVTFSDQLLQEHTFAPSTASSPFPPTTMSDMSHQPLMNGVLDSSGIKTSTTDSYAAMNGHHTHQYNDTSSVSSVVTSVSGDAMISVPEAVKRPSLDSQQQIPVVAITPAVDTTTTGKKAIRTNGLQDFEPTEGLEDMSLARLRWMAAFNKIVSELDLGDPDLVSSILFPPAIKTQTIMQNTKLSHDPHLHSLTQFFEVILAIPLFCFKVVV